MFTEVLKKQEAVAEPSKLILLEGLVDMSKRMKIHFHVEYARLAVSAADESLRRFSDLQSFLETNPALCSSRVTKSFEVASSNSKSPSVSARKVWRPRKGLSSKVEKKLF